MARVELTQCDQCSKTSPEHEVKSYIVMVDGRQVEVLACAAHQAPMEKLIAKGSPVIPQGPKKVVRSSGLTTAELTQLHR